MDPPPRFVISADMVDMMRREGIAGLFTPEVLLRCVLLRSLASAGCWAHRVCSTGAELSCPPCCPRLSAHSLCSEPRALCPAELRRSCRYAVSGDTEHMDERGKVKEPPPFEKVAADWADMGGWVQGVRGWVGELLRQGGAQGET